MTNNGITEKKTKIEIFNLLRSNKNFGGSQ